MEALTNLVVRKTISNDIWDLYDWRTRETEVNWQKSSRSISRAEHESWFKQRILQNNCCPFLVVEDLNKRTSIAVGRFDMKMTNQFLISIILNPKFRNQGLAYPCLKLMLDEVTSNNPGCTFIAQVHRDNDPSVKLFSRAGFSRSTGTDPDFIDFFLN